MMTGIIGFIIMGFLCIGMNIYWYRYCQNLNENWAELMEQQIKDWTNHCEGINNRWKAYCDSLINELEQCGVKMDGDSDE